MNMIWDRPNHQNFLKFQSDSGMTLELKPLEIEGSLSWMVDLMPITGSSPSTQMHTLIAYTFSLFQVLSQSPSRVNVFETTQDHHTFLTPLTHLCTPTWTLPFFFFGHSTQHAGPSFLEQGLNPCALQWELRVVSTGPRGKSRNSVLVTMQSALTSVAKSNCCSPTLIIPFHFPSLLNKYTFFNFVMLRALVFPPPEWPFFGESVFLFQTAVGWTCPGLILGSLSFRHTLSKEVLIPSLGSEYYLHRHLLPTPYFYLSFRFKLHFPFSLVILSDITIFMCNSLEWVSAFCENCMRLLFLCFIIVCFTDKI